MFKVNVEFLTNSSTPTRRAGNDGQDGNPAAVKADALLLL